MASIEAAATAGGGTVVVDVILSMPRAGPSEEGEDGEELSADAPRLWGKSNGEDAEEEKALLR